jgi:hypothetical protein
LAVQRVVAGIAEDRVGERVAGAAQVGGALLDQRFHVRRQDEVGRGEDGIVACAHVLDHLLEAVVDEVGVVAESADHGVGASAAIDQVVAAVAEDRICERIAEALEVGAALHTSVSTFAVSP